MSAIGFIPPTRPLLDNLHCRPCSRWMAWFLWRNTATRCVAALRQILLQPEPLLGRAQRLVESQEVTATLQLCDSLAEQDLLEQLIEQAKPTAVADTAHLHYLLATPFRYPPLRHGSRFGRRDQRSILYASRQVQTCMAEVAYYRLLWWHDMAEPPPNAIQSAHTLFELSYRSDQGIDLSGYAHERYRQALADPAFYRDTQALGSRIRESGADVLVYPSARCPNGGRNVAIFSPAALHSTQPELPRAVLCHTRAEVVFFAMQNQRSEFPLSLFLVDRRLPRPAV